MAKPAFLEVLMWYALQVKCGQEEALCQQIQKKKGMELEDCFFLKRERKKKFGGTFHTIQELVLPGYLFLITKKEKEISQWLQYTPEFQPFLEKESNTSVQLFPLNEQEVNFINHWGDSRHLSKISKIQIKEEKQIKIMEGNLKDYEKQIIKINLHQRTAIIQTMFLGEQRAIYMGFEIWGKDF